MGPKFGSHILAALAEAQTQRVLETLWVSYLGSLSQAEAQTQRVLETLWVSYLGQVRQWIPDPHQSQTG